jgi:hypothetical protein
MVHVFVARRGAVATRAKAALVSALLLAVSACSGSLSFSIGGESVEDAAEALIEGDLATQLGLELTATCPEVADPEVGTEFSCTATTADGETVQFDGVVDREDHIEVVTLNVIPADLLGEYAAAGADTVEASVGFPVVLDCGTDPVVLDASNEMECTLAAADGTDATTAVLTVTDIDTGDFDIRWGE